MPTPTAVAQQLYDAMAHADGEALFGLLTEDFVGTVSTGMPHGVGGEHHGAADMITGVWARIASVYDMHVDPLDYLPVLPSPQPPGSAPIIQDEAAEIGHGLLADRMVEDIRTLVKVNSLANGKKSPSNRQYRVIPYIFAGPSAGQVGQLGQVAATVLDTKFSDVLNAITHPDLWLFTRLIGPVKSRGDILSYLLFEPEFARAAIQLGQQDAQRYLDTMGWPPPTGEGPVDIWRTTI